MPVVLPLSSVFVVSALARKSKRERLGLKLGSPIPALMLLTPVPESTLSPLTFELLHRKGNKRRNKEVGCSKGSDLPDLPADSRQDTNTQL